MRVRVGVGVGVRARVRGRVRVRVRVRHTLASKSHTLACSARLALRRSPVNDSHLHRLAGQLLALTHVVEHLVKVRVRVMVGVGG